MRIGGDILPFPQHGRDRVARHGEVGDAIAAGVFHADDLRRDAGGRELHEFRADAEFEL